MNFQLNEDQQAMVSSLENILRPYQNPSHDDRLSYSYFDAGLRQTLDESGFLDALVSLGPLEAAMVAVECSRLPCVVEAAASVLVVPNLLPDEKLEGPIALIDARDHHKPQRNLAIARTAIIDVGDDVVILAINPDDIESVDSIFAYPYGKFSRPPDLSAGRKLSGDARRTLRLWWRLSIATELAGSAMAAVDFTVEYVKERYVFGKPLGAHQAVQHRLAQCYQIARAMHYLTLRAAWAGTSQMVDVALCYGQQHVHKLVFDLHQFNGGMGVTCEHKLHFWTYRLRALQAEMGGVDGSALDIADQRWSASL